MVKQTACPGYKIILTKIFTFMIIWYSAIDCHYVVTRRGLLRYLASDQF